MKTILIAYDGSECSEAIITELKRAGLPAQLEAHVIAVGEVWTAPAADPAAWAGSPAILPDLPTAQVETAMALEHALALAEKGAARLRAAFPEWQVNWRVEASGYAGSPSGAILQRAREVSADIIFIGSHSRSSAGRFSLGSVSQKVAAEAKCSVRICRPLPVSGTAPRLMVAVDGSLPSQAAVRAVAERAWPAGTVVAAVTVIEPSLRAEFPREQSAEWLRQRNGMLAWLEAVGTAAQRQLELAGLVPERHTLEGVPKNTLLEYAESWNADCLFIGASGLHHPATGTLGTVALTLAVCAHCSVEIVRP